MIYLMQVANNFACGLGSPTSKIPNDLCLLQRISAMEKGQCPTVANWESGNVRSRKATPNTVTTPGQVFLILILNQMQMHSTQYRMST